MRVPKTFALLNRTWRVRYRRMRKDKLGITYPDEALIVLNSTLRDKPALRDHTLVHELLHAAAGAIGWDAVNSDEERIDALAGALVQIIETAECAE